jgi:phosphohistidine phosphatase
MTAGRLVLVRHAKSDYPWGVSDHDRPLNPRGTRDAPEIGRWLEDHVDWAPGVVPAVRVSTARRAQLTWLGVRSRLSERWAAADVSDESRIYEADVATLIDVAVDAAPAGLVVMVGHNPGLADLVEHLAVADDLRAQALVKFPTASVAVLEVVGDAAYADALMTPGSMRVRDFVVPRG